jgi:APA family basic amino acid/polyamine antiporter
MVGSGVFLLPASLGPYGAWSILGWLVTSGGSLLLALVFARLGRRLPAAGGPYAYSRHGYGDFAGFLVAWGYWISILASNAAIAVALVSYLSFFWPLLGTHPSLGVAVALAMVWLLTAVNAHGVRDGGRVQVTTTLLKLLPLVAIGTLGFVHFDVANFEVGARPLDGLSAVTASVALTLWAFLGLESATVPADSVRDPARTIPRATVLGVLVASCVYIISTVAVMGILPSSVLEQSRAPFADAAAAVWGDWAAAAMAAGAAISCFGCLNGWILLQGQLPLAVARDGLFPPIFGRLSKHGTPAIGLVISSVLVSVLLILNYTRGLVGLFTYVIQLATLSAVVPYALCAVVEWMLAAREKRSARPTLALTISLLGFVYAMWAIAGSGRDTVYWGFLLLGAGLPVYAWIAHRREKLVG